MTRAATLLAAAVLVLGLVAPATAHEVRPGYLELEENDGDVFQLLWKVPARGEERFGIRPVLPAHCARASDPRVLRSDDAWVERTAVTCPGGLDGHTIGVEGLTATMTDVLVRLVRASGTAQVVRLSPASPSFVVEAAPHRLDVALTYLRLGVEHILLGVDHLLFVLALLILVGGTRRLVSTVTAFTVAHSLTLAAATLGFARVPQRPVEAVIALSIVFVAAEIIHARQGRAGVTERAPWVVAFVFGLLHGFGFAGALAEVGLPPQAIPLALFFFNVGVEVGQLLFVAVVLAIAAFARRLVLAPPAWGWWVPTYAIGALAAYWTIERVAGL